MLEFFVLSFFMYILVSVIFLLLVIECSGLGVATALDNLLSLTDFTHKQCRQLFIGFLLPFSA